MNIRKYLALTVVLLSQNSFAHGEDQLGPHSGYVKEPGSYHVEVIPGKDTLDIMLLDANFKNPTVLNSHIKVKIKQGSNAYVLRCESMENYFSCPVSDKMLAREGSLVIQSARQQEEGDAVTYPLPLRLTDDTQTV